MITVVIPTRDSAHLIGPCLSSLVAAAVDGLVREVVLADGGSTDGTLDIGEDCGARVVSAGDDLGQGLAEACERPRGEWLMLLEPDALLPEGWRQVAEKQVNAGWDRAVSLTRPGVSWFRRPFTPPQGLLLSARLYQAKGGFHAGDKDFARLIKAVGARRLTW